MARLPENFPCALLFLVTVLFLFCVRRFNLRFTLLTDADPIWDPPHPHTQEKVLNVASQVDIEK